MNIEIKKSQKPVKYEDALTYMEKRLVEIHQNKSNDLIWILEHEDLYTAGTSSKESEIISLKDLIQNLRQELEETQFETESRVQETKSLFQSEIKQLKSSLERLREKLQTAQDSEADKIQKFLAKSENENSSLKKIDERLYNLSRK